MKSDTESYCKNIRYYADKLQELVSKEFDSDFDNYDLHGKEGEEKMIWMGIVHEIASHIEYDCQRIETIAGKVDSVKLPVLVRSG